jgi:hypothetical protein
VLIDPAPILFGSGFGESTLSLGHPELHPTFRRTLLILQSHGALTGGPEVDHFRHVNGRWYPDACEWVGTDPLIGLNYADTVTVDHWQIPPIALYRLHSRPPATSFFVLQIILRPTAKAHKGSGRPRKYRWLRPLMVYLPLLSFKFSGLL